MHASKLKDTVDKYMESTQTIADVCKIISHTNMVCIDPKHTYHPDDFQEEQKLHCEDTGKKLQFQHQRVLDILKATYDVSVKA